MIRVAGAGALAVCVLLLSAACGGDDDAAPMTTGAVSGSPTSTVTGSGTATQSVTATPTSAPGGPEVLLSVPEAGGVVALPAGNYRTARFRPEAHFSLRDGWSASADTARLVDLFRGDPETNCVCLMSPDGVIDPASGVKAALPGTGSVDDIINWLTSNPSLQTSSPSSLEITNIPARQLDVQVRTGTGTVTPVDYFAAGGLRFGVKAGERQHLIVLSLHTAPVIIAQRSSAAEYSDYFAFVEQVVGSLTFAN